MKKLIPFFLLCALALSWAVDIKVARSGDHIKFFDDATFYIDTGVTTEDGTYYWDISLLPRNAATTVLGTFGITCADSGGGTDTMDVTLTIYGNYSRDKNGQPEGTWTSLGTVAITSATGASTEGIGTITDAEDPLFLWAKVSNDEVAGAAQAGEKSQCTDVWFTPRKPIAEQLFKK
jgi:hypothetical protein